MLTTTQQWLFDRFMEFSFSIQTNFLETTTTLWRFGVLLGTLVMLLLILILVYGWMYYRSSIQSRMQQIEADLKRGIMLRDTANAPRRLIRCLELNPKFRNHVAADSRTDWNLISLGEYLSTLRPALIDNNQDLPRLLERELETTIGYVLLQKLGPRMGAAVLPMLGISDVQSTLAKVASHAASWWAARFMVQQAEKEIGQQSTDPSDMDRGTLPFSLAELAAFANVHQTMVQSDRKYMEISPLEWMKRGEIGYTPSFSNEANIDDSTDDVQKQANSKDESTSAFPQLIPNPFVVSEHWSWALEQMEVLLGKQDSMTDTSPAPNAEATTTTRTYDPEDRSFPTPTPVNERLLPGLHFGWGKAQCTHTKREILRNRLLAVLLNKLSYNYYHREQNLSDKNLFLLQMDPDSKTCSTPGEFVQALLDSGHTIEVCPRESITTFGIAACVKEEDGSWSNIPIAFFFRTGYERPDGRPACVVAPHGGMDLSLKGPLVGRDNKDNDYKCNVKFYMAIEGLCGWHSNHNADVPWIEPIASTSAYDDEHALMAIRMAGLLAVTFNALGTEMNLPFGGYGILGVCSDTAALLDFAIRGETSMYPLVSTGRFLMHIARRLLQLRYALAEIQALREEFLDTRRLMTAACTLDSDLHTSPSNLVSATRRFLAITPEIPHFQLTVESKRILLNMTNIYKEFVNWPEEHNEVDKVEKSDVMKESPNIFQFLFASQPQDNSYLVRRQ